MAIEGIHRMVSPSTMIQPAKRMRDFYAMKPGAGIIQREFGFYSLDRWKDEGHISESTSLNDLFAYEKPGFRSLHNLGWVTAAFCPMFETSVLEDRGDYEVILDNAGRHILVFKGRRDGFMPEYLDHPVKDMRSWEEACKWRLDPSTPERYEKFATSMEQYQKLAMDGYVLSQRVIGGYMYLRSLIGPTDVLYKFYDEPELIHDCMRTWFKLADAVIAKHQQYVTLDEIFFGEDICYNHGPLIAPNMIREFLFPYYQQLIANTRSRQLDKSRRLHVHLDTDGNATMVIDLYREIGMDVMSPFEVASGCDVVAIGRKYPDLLMLGGFDKRILASGQDAIDREINRIMPVMKARGGYIPTCDHGVPAEVNFADYMHYRKRMLEFAD